MSVEYVRVQHDIQKRFPCGSFRMEIESGENLANTPIYDRVTREMVIFLGWNESRIVYQQSTDQPIQKHVSLLFVKQDTLAVELEERRQGTKAARREEDLLTCRKYDVTPIQLKAWRAKE